MIDSAVPDLSAASASGRWVRLGPYYAMFPVEFVTETIQRHGRPGQPVIDPFCGRGTVPFVAMTMGLPAIAAEINPVGWVYSKTKTAPHASLKKVKQRIGEVGESATDADRHPADEFQEMAFCSNALGFINAARRQLDWRRSRLDRTVAALLIQHLHAKRGNGLSNQLRPSRSMDAAYCVRWWRSKGLERAPEVDACTFLERRAEWRYAKGVPKPAGTIRPRVALGDARRSLPRNGVEAGLVLTSPPYRGVTNYRADSWLRLWALEEGPCEPDWRTDQKFENGKRYEETLSACFGATLKRTSADAVWCVRSDARERTREVIIRVLNELLPYHDLKEKPAPYKTATQTALYGDKTKKPGEVDLYYMPRRGG